MEMQEFLSLMNKALIATGVIALPILIPSLVAGVLISIFQAVTQISEQTLTFVPKLFILIASFLITGPWITRYLMNYTTDIITQVSEISSRTSIPGP